MEKSLAGRNVREVFFWEIIEKRRALVYDEGKDGEKRIKRKERAR